jgi:hypothetical protein
MNYIVKALELEDTIKNYERRAATGWFVPDYSLHCSNICSRLFDHGLTSILYFRKYVSTLRPDKAGKIGSLIDTIGKHHFYQLVCFLEFYGPV